MPKYLIAIQHPDDYDPSLEDAQMGRDIDELNDAMVAAGVRVFVGGLQPAERATSLRKKLGGIVEKPGPYLATDEHVGGFWVLDVADEAEAIEWGRKAVIACRVSVEVRPFF